MIYSSFIIPLLMFMIGFIIYKCPPKKPNWFVGYRTRRSMKDEKVWKEANHFCGKVLMIIGSILLFITLLIYILNYFEVIRFNETLFLIVVFSEIGLILLSTLIVENKIKR